MVVKGLQIIGMIVGIYHVAQTIYNYRSGNYNLWKSIFFLLFWSGITTLFLKPSLAGLVQPILTTSDVINSVLVVGLLVSFSILMNLYQQLANLDRKFTNLVQNLSINEYITGSGHMTINEVGKNDE